MRRFALLVTAAASVLVAGAAPRSAAAPGPDPEALEHACGVNVRVDEVLGCKAPSSSEPVAAANTAASLASRQRPPASTFARPQFDPERLLVRFARGTEPKTIAALVRSVGASIERRIPQLRLYALRTTPARRDAVLRRLRAAESVAKAEREVRVSMSATTPNDAVWPSQSGLRRIGLPEAWDVARGSEQTVVAVVDTGVNALHPDLAGAVLPGFDFVNGDADASDDDGHGTAVAGVVAARANNTEGVAGVCWLCRILPAKVLDSNGNGTSNGVAAGIVWAADHDADVINLSLGGPGVAGALDDAVAYARAKGAIVVAAAGNSGVSTPFYPAAALGVIGVAATDDADRFYDWSNRGAWVAVAAPGCNASTFAQGYGVFCGTSSAAPVVAGIAGLALTRYASTTRDEVEHAIAASAVPIGPEVRYGRVHASVALALLRPATVNATYNGTLGRTTASRVYWRSVGAGVVSATLASPSRARLTLTLRGAGGKVVARATGRAPLRIAREVAAGELSLMVSGRGTRVRFTLRVEHVLAESGR